MDDSGVVILDVSQCCSRYVELLLFRHPTLFGAIFASGDDRVWSDHGREVRMPFLDESVVALLRRLPLPVICDPRLPPGVGDKLLLRVVGRMLGLGASTTLVKRAIHFGSRIAKQSNVVSFGSNRAAKGDAFFVLPKSASSTASCID